jgi:hypothetical protein
MQIVEYACFIVNLSYDSAELPQFLTQGFKLRSFCGSPKFLFKIVASPSMDPALGRNRIDLERQTIRL